MIGVSFVLFANANVAGVVIPTKMLFPPETNYSEMLAKLLWSPCAF